MQGIAGRARASSMPRATIAHAQFVCRGVEVPHSPFFTTVPPFVPLSQSHGVSSPSPACVEAFSLYLCTANSEVRGEETRCTVNYKSKTNTKTLQQYIDLDVDILCATKRGARVILLRLRKPCTPARYWKPYILHASKRGARVTAV